MATLTPASQTATTLSGIPDMLYQGTWSSTTTYSTNDVVVHGSGTFISIQNGNLNNTPPAVGDTWWTVLAFDNAAALAIALG